MIIVRETQKMPKFLFFICFFISFQIQGHYWETESQAIHKGIFLTGLDIERIAIEAEHTNKDQFVALMNNAKTFYQTAVHFAEATGSHGVYPDVYRSFIAAHEGNREEQLKISGLFSDGRGDDVPDNRLQEMYWLQRSMQDDAKEPYNFYRKPDNTSIFQLTARETSGLLTTVVSGMLAGATAGKFFDDAYNEGDLFHAFIGAGAGAICGIVAWIGGSKFVTVTGNYLSKRRERKISEEVEQRCIDEKLFTVQEYRNILREAQDNLQQNFNEMHDILSQPNLRADLQSVNEAEIDMSDLSSLAEEITEEFDIVEPNVFQATEPISLASPGRSDRIFTSGNTPSREEENIQNLIPTDISNEMRNFMKNIGPENRKALEIFVQRTKLLREIKAREMLKTMEQSKSLSSSNQSQ